MNIVNLGSGLVLFFYGLYLIYIGWANNKRGKQITDIASICFRKVFTVLSGKNEEKKLQKRNKDYELIGFFYLLEGIGSTLIGIYALLDYFSRQ